MTSGTVQLLQFAAAAAERIAARLSPSGDATAVILGSGLDTFIDAIDRPRTVPFANLPGFPSCTAPGHSGRFVAGRWRGHAVVVAAGRFHAYEGHTPEMLVLPVVALGLLGVRRIVITNAAGALNPAYCVGDVILIRDHVNLLPQRGRLGRVLQAIRGIGGAHGGLGLSGSPAEPPAEEHPPSLAANGACPEPDPPRTSSAGANPLSGASYRGPSRAEMAFPRVPVVSTGLVYDPLWRRSVRRTLSGDMPIAEGVYAAMSGPNYETPAEARWLRRCGVDLVGMSSVPEALAAAAMGMRTLAFSIVTNSHARQPSDARLSADHVLSAARAALSRAERLIEAALRHAPGPTAVQRSGDSQPDLRRPGTPRRT